MKTEIINKFYDAYEQNDLENCKNILFFLVLMYNTDIREGEPYDHDLKHILFKTNCIRNPIGIRNTANDYEKTKQIVGCVLELVKAINNPKVETPDIFQKDLTIDDKIIMDILDVAVYTECFYKMNSVNSARMDECEAGKIPFVEQLISLLLFHQDQTRLVRENYRDFLNPDCITGILIYIKEEKIATTVFTIIDTLVLLCGFIKPIFKKYVDKA